MGSYNGSYCLLVLDLSEIASSDVRGIYGAAKDKLPKRMRYLDPEAAASFRGLGVVVSDMYRSAESSLWAIRNRRGAQAPGFSGHNYGRSIDLAIQRSKRALGVTSKGALDAYMSQHGWLCHRRDHEESFESWHYNYGVSDFLNENDRRTSAALERFLRYTYGKKWALTDREIQIKLRELNLYAGAIDGILGPISHEATRAFQRCWALDVDGIAGPATQRTLSFVTASKRIV